MGMKTVEVSLALSSSESELANSDSSSDVVRATGAWGRVSARVSSDTGFLTSLLEDLDDGGVEVVGRLMKKSGPLPL
jgi:hypothetical protein